jgi:uncharacterized protein YbjT (DUF2867 family)
MTNLNLLVLGASGNTGRRLVEMALARGHQVTAIVRATAILPDRDGLRVVIGDVLDPTILKEASYSVDAVVSCLGIRKENPSDPWSRLISPEDFTERSAQLALDAMKLNGIKRLVAISSAGIGDSWSSVDPDLQHVIETSNVGKIFQDLNKMEEALTKSGLDTLALRPVAVVDGEVSGRAGLVERFDKGSKIMTGDIAKWILDAVERPEAFRSRHEMIGTVSPDPAAL